MEEEVGTNSSSKFVYGTTPQHCQQMINHSLAHHPMVKFVRGALEKAGCPVGDKFFKPEECSMQVGGGFKRDDGVVICSNHVMLQDEVDVALTHELLHAYDHCRAANLDWTNCEHHACSEIRAANLSGDCHWKRELNRGNFNIQGQHQICVKRRAQISVALNPHCSQDQAIQAVDNVWNTCYKDTQPFDRVP